MLQEPAGLQPVSRWQCPPAARHSSLVALWGHQGLLGITSSCLQQQSGPTEREMGSEC